MKITKTITINKPAEDVWKVLGQNFDRADEWMAIVPKSYKKTDHAPVENAPMEGRVCEFTPDSGGFSADEVITYYNEADRHLKLHITPVNAPSFLPLLENDLDLRVRTIDSTHSEVIWESTPTLNTAGKFLSPVVKLGIGKGFYNILEELKVFVETGKPHPRKLKSMAS